MIRRHVAVWATTPTWRLLTLPAALLVATSIPLTVAVLAPRAIGGTWPALLGLAYLTTTALRPGSPSRPAPTVACVVPRAGGLRAAPVVTRGGAPTRPARGGVSPRSTPGRATIPPGAAVLPTKTAAAPGHHNSQGARFGTLRAPWGSVPNVPRQGGAT
jgi:hypothetical protein